MKTLLLALMCAFTIGLSAAAPELPAWEKKKLAEVTAYCESNPTINDTTVFNHVVKDVLTANPETFDALVSTVQTTVAKGTYTKGTVEGKTEACISYICLWYLHQRFVKDGYERAKTKAPAILPRYVRYSQKLGLTVEAEYAMWVSVLCNTTGFDPSDFTCNGKRFAELCNQMPEATVKADLKKINRALTPKLLTDQKDKYVPVVTAIRTMLETY